MVIRDAVTPVSSTRPASRAQPALRDPSVRAAHRAQPVLRVLRARRARRDLPVLQAQPVRPALKVSPAPPVFRDQLVRKAP